MKIKNLIKLICLLVVIVALSLWAFGANISLFGKKFIAWDEAMLKGNDIGKTAEFVYSIEAPKDAQGFDVHKETINAVEVISKRAELWSYKGVSTRVEGLNDVVVDMPLSVYRTGIEEILGYNGKIQVSDSAKNVLFTEKDIDGATLRTEQAADGSTTVYVDVKFTDEAKANLQQVTSNGAYSLNFALDTDKATATVTGSEAIKNGEVTLKFATGSESSAEIFEMCANSGAIEGTVKVVAAQMITGTAGENAITVLGLAILAIIIVAAVYFILSSKLLGLAATLSVFIGFLAYEFFAATFNWLLVDASAVAGMLVGMLIMIFAHILVLNKVTNLYLKGKDVVSALDNGVVDARNFVFELSIVAAVIGIGFWIIGSGFDSFGIAVMGGAVISALASIYVLKFIAKIFVGLGASNKAMGLKRGE